MADRGVLARELDPAMPVDRIRTMTALVEETRRPWSVLAWLLGALATIACLLAAIGPYGVLASGVAERRCEFGIRMALGAEPAHVMMLVLRRTVTLTTVASAWVFSARCGWRACSLVGVEPFDRLTWLAAMLSLAAVALVASALAARRAARVNLTGTLKVQ